MIFPSNYSQIEDKEMKVHKDSGFWLNFMNLTVWAPEEKSWYRRKPTKPKLTILNNVSGSIKNGEFVAVLGPSGSGKTTFLASLAGKLTLPSEGRVTMNGVNVKDLEKGVVEIVPQFEVFMESITVAEHLRFMTEMKLGSWKRSVNRLKLESLMSELMLKSLADSVIKGLSGGERRLLSLAGSLLVSPKVLICDEPTTGLDSYNAKLVVGILKNLANSGITVICSIHQPSSDLFSEFNCLMLMAEGKLVFHGAEVECRRVFESIGLNCPKNYNPAEFYIKAISTDPNTNRSEVDNIISKYQKRVSLCDETTGVGSPQAAFKVIRRNWFVQVSLLLWRTSLTVKRDIKVHLFQLITTMMISATIISACFHGVRGDTQKGVQNMIGFLWVVVSEIAYGLAYNALHTFEEDLTLFKREAGMYQCSAFYVSRFISFLPRCVIWPCVFVTIATLIVAMPNNFLTTAEMIAALIPAGVACTAYGLGMGAIFLSTGLINDIMPCVDLPLFILSGGFIRLSSIPGWLYSIKYISHFFYAMDAVSNIYWRKIPNIECDLGFAGGTCIKDGASLLEADGYSYNFISVDTLGFISLSLGWSFLGYLGLKRQERKGYAY